MQKTPHTILLVMCLLVSAFGQKRPIVFPDSLKEITTIGVLPFNINSYHLTSGGIHEYDDSITRQANSHFMERIEHTFSENGFDVVFIDSTHPDEAAFREIKNHFQTVERMIRLHVFGIGQQFQTRIKDFDYSVGSIEEICERNNLDGLFIIVGWDEQMTARRRKMISGAVAGSVASAIVGAFLGFGGGIAIPRGDICFVCGGIVNREGRLIWYNYYSEQGKIDISDAEDVKKITGGFFKKLEKK